MTTPLDRIRNFSIIAHIDHGKSTLADRLIQRTGGLTEREMTAQVLDNMDIEKERGITIKAQTVRLHWKGYELNLMDTPGHVDFAYEVSRSLAACEGALLVVDAAQGVEAQTLANVYQSIEHDHEIVPVINKIDLPAAEPWIEAVIYVPDEYLGSILKLCQDRRGIQKNLTYVGGRAQVTYELPLNEVVFDFYDRLKSLSKGYASFDYHQIGYREGDLVKMSILVNEEPVDALSMIVHRGTAEVRGRGMVERLKELIPRHLFKIPIQAAIGGKVIARETISAMRKDVTAKCYGGDASRKRKLLDKQKKGKARMREYGNVSIPQEAFIAALRMGDEG